MDFVRFLLSLSIALALGMFTSGAALPANATTASGVSTTMADLNVTSPPLPEVNFTTSAVNETMTSPSPPAGNTTGDNAQPGTDPVSPSGGLPAGAIAAIVVMGFLTLVTVVVCVLVLKRFGDLQSAINYIAHGPEETTVAAPPYQTPPANPDKFNLETY